MPAIAKIFWAPFVLLARLAGIFLALPFFYMALRNKPDSEEEQDEG